MMVATSRLRPEARNTWAPVAQFTKPIEEQRASECVTSFAFVQAGMGASPQIEIADPVEREQCTFQASDLTQGDGEAILARERCQATQHR